MMQFPSPFLIACGWESGDNTAGTFLWEKRQSRVEIWRFLQVSSKSYNSIGISIPCWNNLLRFCWWLCQVLLLCSVIPPSPQVHGQPADGDAWDRVPLLLPRPAHHQRGRLCTHPPPLHQRGWCQRIFGERATQHPRWKGYLVFLFFCRFTLPTHSSSDSCHSSHFHVM